MPMQIYPRIEDLPPTPIEPVATIGNFDGVHRGHQAILARLSEEAHRVGAPTMVITFYPHPRQVLQPDEPFSLIMSLKDRLRQLWELELDYVLVIPFDGEFAELTAREFVEEILWDALRVRGIYVGENTAFGHARSGDVRFLASEGRRLGFALGVVDPVVVEGRRISSTRVRRSILGGDMPLAARLIGRHHRVVGAVVEGDRRGREIGFPTANIEPDGGLLPPHGVYAAWANVDDGGRYPAVVNIGVRPSFAPAGDNPDASSRVVVEAHLIDFEGDLYGRELALALVQRQRDEVVFPGAKALGRQIRADVRDARRILHPRLVG